MIFGIVTHAVHKIKNGEIYAYEPYVREMNLWAKHVDEIVIICPTTTENVDKIEVPYLHNNIKIVEIPNFDITSLKNALRTILVIPSICRQIYRVMKQVDHIHLRCPGNIGLLGCIVQLFFPFKPKTAKYAGNWDPESKQPISYKIQKKILSSTILTKKMKVLVYGQWKNQTKNIVPFFTASYHQKEIKEIPEKKIAEQINLIFVGGLTIGKQPMLSVKTTHQLIKKGYNVSLNIYGDGVLRNKVESYIQNNNLEHKIKLHGNVNKATVKMAFQQSHFLIFISKSEGWPKVVAEAMFWKCLPITSKVSCIPYMLGNNTRGALIGSSVADAVLAIEDYLNNKNKYQTHIENASVWSRAFTLDTFENELKKLLL